MPWITHLLVYSVRVSNELGAGNARLAKFSVKVVSVTSISIGVICMAVVFATRDYFPYLFTTSEAVANETTRLAILLGITVLLNSLQPVLSGKPIRILNILTRWHFFFTIKQNLRFLIFVKFPLLLLFKGVAVGAGWQSLVAYINIACYYIVGFPAGIVLGFTFKFGAVVS